MHRPLCERGGRFSWSFLNAMLFVQMFSKSFRIGEGKVANDTYTILGWMYIAFVSFQRTLQGKPFATLVAQKGVRVDVFGPHVCAEITRGGVHGTTSRVGTAVLPREGTCLASSLVACERRGASNSTSTYVALKCFWRGVGALYVFVEGGMGLEGQ